MTKTLRDLTAEEGRSAFGEDAANYDAARPPYPDWVYARLAERGPVAQVFEIGPGTGQATARLLSAGAQSVTAIEPDARLAAYLRDKLAAPALTVLNTTFEDAALPDGAFDLGAAATSFHWMDQRPALAKVAHLLRPGGTWAMWWNVFGDPDRRDDFHDATNELLNGFADTPSHHTGQAHPFGIDVQARMADIEAAGAFERAAHDVRKWTLILTTAQTRALYASFSQFSVLEADERTRILDSLAEIAETKFGGRVERNMCTALYTARRR